METFIHRLNRILRLFVILLVLTAPVYAHTFWLEATENGAHLFLGDRANDERYEEDAVEQAAAIKNDGTPVQVEKHYGHGHMHLTAPSAHLIWTKANYGFWRKTIRGWQEGTKQDPGRTLSSAWHVQYAKIAKNYTKPTKVGMDFEIVLESVEKKKIRGVVYLNGKPAPKVPIYLGHKKVARTNKKGFFKVSTPKGAAVLSAVHKEKLKDNPKADQKITTTTYTLKI